MSLAVLEVSGYHTIMRDILTSFILFQISRSTVEKGVG
jgi:hypothetical protein